MNTPDQVSILKIAREMFIDEHKWGTIIEKATRGGYFDNGSNVQKHMEAATAEFLRRREENYDE